MCVCVCVCVHVCTCVCVCLVLCSRVCVCAYVQIHSFVCAHVYMCVWVCVCTHIYECTCFSALVCVFGFVHVYVCTMCVCVCVCNVLCMCVYVLCVCVFASVCAYCVYECVCMHIHLCVCICLCTCVCVWHSSFWSVPLKITQQSIVVNSVYIAELCTRRVCKHACIIKVNSVCITELCTRKECGHLCHSSRVTSNMSATWSSDLKVSFHVWAFFSWHSQLCSHCSVSMVPWFVRGRMLARYLWLQSSRFSVGVASPLAHGPFVLPCEHRGLEVIACLLLAWWSRR